MCPNNLGLIESYSISYFMRFRKLLIVCILGIISLSATAQMAEPKWVRHIPKSTSETFYYRVTYGEGKNYDAAYSKAFARAIYENACKRGIYVDVNTSIEDIEADITRQVNIDNRSMNLFINKVCEYRDEHPNGSIKLYILWQIGVFGKSDPKFDTYEDCDKL